MKLLLLNDDSLYIRAWCYGALLEGYSVVAVQASVVALAVMRAEQVDLLVQDCRRPDMDGETFYKLIKADHALQGIPVLFCTSDMLSPKVENLRQQHNDGYISSLSNLPAFRRVVEQVMENRGVQMPTRRTKEELVSIVESSAPGFWECVEGGIWRSDDPNNKGRPILVQYETGKEDTVHVPAVLDDKDVTAYLRTPYWHGETRWPESKVKSWRDTRVRA